MVSIRLDEDQIEKLQFYGSEMGYTTSELIRKMIENADDVTMQQKQAINIKEVNIELKKIVEKRYQSSLLKNLTNNMNQVAHYVNKNKNNSSQKALLLAFQTLEKQVKHLERVIRDGNH